MAVLTWLSGENKNTQVVIGDEVLFGRGKHVHVRLDDRRSSREHARLVKRDGGFWIEDLGSRNGTFLNDHQVTEVPLQVNPGDILRIGLSWFYFGEPTITEDNLDVFVGYKVDRQLLHSQGGMLLEATQENLERPVHLRVISINIASNAELVHRRFLEEVQTVAKLVHRNIAMLIDFGARKMYLYAAFEYLDGEELTAFVEDHAPLDVMWVLETARQVAGGLDYAHRQGVTHLNLQPEVILLDGSRPVIRDFGISRLVGELTSDDQTGAGMAGITAYTSPERASGESGNEQSDVYSFGMLLYYMLTGQAPFTETSPYELIEAHQQRSPVELRSLRSDIPTPVQDAIGQMIAKEPRDRPKDFKQVLSLLEACRTVFEVIEVRRQHEEGGGGNPLKRLLSRPLYCWILFLGLGWMTLLMIYRLFFAAG